MGWTRYHKLMGVTVAEERIVRLHTQAKQAAKRGDDLLAKQFVRRTRRIAERQRISLPRCFKRFTCDHCDAYLIPGLNARVRTQSGHVVITCECGSQSRYPYHD